MADEIIGIFARLSMSSRIHIPEAFAKQMNPGPRGAMPRKAGLRVPPVAAPEMWLWGGWLAQWALPMLFTQNTLSTFPGRPKAEPGIQKGSCSEIWAPGSCCACPGDVAVAGLIVFPKAKAIDTCAQAKPWHNVTASGTPTLPDAWFYILANKRNGTIYCGSTDDISRRVKEHKDHRFPGFTARYDVTMLVYLEHHELLMDARAREYKVKKWRRAWKLELIEAANPHWHDLYFDLNN